MSARHTERPAMSSETELTRRIDAIKAQIAKLG